MRILIILFLLFPVQQQVLCANEPEEEFRAVWLTTFAGLDWPDSFDPEEQKRSLLNIIEHLHAANFNAIIFQARSRGDAFYQSFYEPWARELTGTTGKDPGWDPLAFLIEHARSRGMEVHAWFNVYKVWGGSPIPYGLDPPHILDRNPGWARLDGGEWWLDPGEPGVHLYLMKVALDLIERYPVDGIHFDHIRYPGRRFDDAITHKRFGGNKNRDECRRDNITNFVQEFYRYATAIRPDLKICSAPVGVYKPISGFFWATAYVDYFQDPEKWLREGIHDYIAPQVYWDIAKNPKFDAIMGDWMNRSHNRHIYGGIGIFRPEIYNELYRQVFITRALGIPGQVYFRYAHLGNSEQIVKAYNYPAAPPRMPWKENNENYTQERIDEIAQMLEREIVFSLESDPDRPDSLRMSFYLPGNSYVSIRIIDELTGRPYFIIDNFFETGFHSVPIHRNRIYLLTRCIVQVNGRITERLLRWMD